MEEGGKISLLERIKSAPGQLTQYITEMSQSIVKEFVVESHEDALKKI